ncbi:MAG: hypothetical protein RBS43_06085, partial [Candidatus Cloacimonas sp.]|nr:hypothetical protein [Candidatus Cloacimonas sp.]
MKKIIFILLLISSLALLSGQYLSESFEGTWAGTPAVPTGWSNIHTTGTGSYGTDPIYWVKNSWSGS